MVILLYRRPSCDKVVFIYSWGIVKRKQTVWIKTDMPHAKT